MHWQQQQWDLSQQFLEEIEGKTKLLEHQTETTAN